MTSSAPNNGRSPIRSSNSEEVHSSNNSLLVFSGSSQSANQSSSSSLTSLDTFVSRICTVGPEQPIVVTPAKWHSSTSETPTLTPPALACQSTSCSSYTTSSQSSLSPTESSTSIESSSSSHSTSHSNTSSSTFSSSSLDENSSSSTSSFFIREMPQKSTDGDLKSPDCKEPLVSAESASNQMDDPPVGVDVEESENVCCRRAPCKCNFWHAAPEPVILIACGSFNPITTMHLRMMGEHYYRLG